MKLLILICVFTITFDKVLGIVGGYNAPLNAYPSTVGVMEISGLLIGEATILNTNYVLTSASLINAFSLTENDLFIRAGSTNIFYGSVYNTSSQIVYPTFDMLTFENDIALIRLAEPFVFNEYLQAASLPSESLANGENANFTSWGNLDIDAHSSYWLQEIAFTTISNEDCKKSKLNLTGLEVCTIKTSEAAPCEFDYGAPIYQDGVVVGLFSHTHLCEGTDPSIFTRVFEYLDWINENISK